MDSGLNLYNEQLREEIRRQRFRVGFISSARLTTASLRLIMRTPRSLVLASEHEGFCVPLAEAMYYGVPIVAYGGSAIAGTLGEAAIVWETPSPMLFAETIRLLEERPHVRADRGATPAESLYAQFTIKAIEQRLADAFSHSSSIAFVE